MRLSAREMAREYLLGVYTRGDGENTRSRLEIRLAKLAKIFNYAVTTWNFAIVRGNSNCSPFGRTTGRLTRELLLKFAESFVV